MSHASYPRPEFTRALGAIRAVLIILTLLITVKSVAPADPVNYMTYVDKILHTGAYGCLTLLAIFAFPNAKFRYIVGFFFCYGALVEMGQAVMDQGRTGSTLDLAANTLGILAVISLWAILYELFDS